MKNKVKSEELSVYRTWLHSSFILLYSSCARLERNIACTLTTDLSTRSSACFLLALKKSSSTSLSWFGSRRVSSAWTSSPQQPFLFRRHRSIAFSRIPTDQQILRYCLRTWKPRKLACIKRTRMSIGPLLYWAMCQLMLGRHIIVEHLILHVRIFATGQGSLRTTKFCLWTFLSISYPWKSYPHPTSLGSEGVIFLWIFINKIR